MADAEDDVVINPATRIAMGAVQGKRPKLSDLYKQLSEQLSAPDDFSSVAPVMRARQDQAERDFAAGTIMSALGGRAISPVGRALAKEGLDNSGLLRLNEADVGYVHPETGDIVANPANYSRRREKGTQAMIAAAERGEAADASLAARAESDAANRALRESIANANIALRRDLAAQRRAAAAAKADAPKPLSPAAQKEQADLAQQLNSVDMAIDMTKAVPSAFGKLRGIPGGIAGPFGESVAGTFDSQAEADARAQVFNVVSSVIKARAGTAQSAHELRVLNGFLPSPYDNATQVENKMTAFKKYLEGQKSSHLEAVTGKPAPQAAPAPRERVYNPKTGKLE